MVLNKYRVPINSFSNILDLVFTNIILSYYNVERHLNMGLDYFIVVTMLLVLVI